MQRRHNDRLACPADQRFVLPLQRACVGTSKAQHGGHWGRTQCRGPACAAVQEGLVNSCYQTACSGCACNDRMAACTPFQSQRTRQPAARAEHDIYGCPLCILFGRGVALCGPSHRRQAAGAALRPLCRAIGPCQQATLAPNGPVQRERWQSEAHEQEGCRRRRRRAAAAGGGGKQWRRQCRRLWGAFLTLFGPRCGHPCAPSGLAAQRRATSGADLLCGRGLGVVVLPGNFRVNSVLLQCVHARFEPLRSVTIGIVHAAWQDSLLLLRLPQAFDKHRDQWLARPNLRGAGSGRTVLAAGPGNPSTTTRICVSTRIPPLQAQQQRLQAAAAESLPAMRACSASAARPVAGHAVQSHQGRSAGRPAAPAPRNAIGASASTRRSVATAAAAVRPHCCLALLSGSIY